MLVIENTSEKVGVMEKGYVVIANSEDGWKFGGGSLVNRPYGETLGILDRNDERAAR